MQRNRAMEILTWNHDHRHATLNVVSTDDGRYAWTVSMHDPSHRPADRTLTSPVDFETSVHAAVDGLRAFDSIKTDEA